jgi:hypothetical protein
VLAHHGGVHDGQLRARRFQGGARREATEEVGHSVSALVHHGRPEVMRAGHHIRDDLGVGGIRHRWLEDPDHRGDARIESDSLADDLRVAVERRAPESMGQDHGARRAGSVV